MNRGVHLQVVYSVFEVVRSTVFKWLSMDRAGTLQEVKHSPVGRSRLTAKQIDQVRRWIVGSNPQQLQFELALWTTRIVADLIQREFGITYSRQRIGELLRSWGLSPQKPLVRAYEQDPERVAAWKTDTFPKIQARAKKTGARIYFADESGARTDHHSVTTWGELGRTPIERGTRSRARR